MRERHPAAKSVRDKVNQVKPSVGAQPVTGNTSVFLGKYVIMAS